MRRWRRILFGISPSETTFAKRGFASTAPAVQGRLELIGATFVEGYHAGLESSNAALTSRLSAVPAERRGFAFEGAAMALAIRDALSFARRLDQGLSQERGSLASVHAPRGDWMGGGQDSLDAS